MAKSRDLYCLVLGTWLGQWGNEKDKDRGTHTKELGSGGLCELERSSTGYTASALSMFIRHSPVQGGAQEEVSVGQESQAVHIWETEATAAGLCAHQPIIQSFPSTGVCTHSRHSFSHQGKAVPSPWASPREEDFAISFSLRHWLVSWPGCACVKQLHTRFIRSLHTHSRLLPFSTRRT